MAARIERIERTAPVARLPYGIGRFGVAWYVLIAALLAIVAWGLFAYSRQYTDGLIVTGMRDIGTMGGAAWGLYITFDIYFVGISFAGITTAALIRLLNLQHMRPVSRMAELLTVIALILAAFTILPDLGQPLRALVNLPLYARPQSPFFGTFTLVIAGYLFASLAYFYVDGRRDAAICAKSPSRLRWFYRLWAAGYGDRPAERRRHSRVTFLLAITILPLLVTAHSTLGFVFGLQVGRPGWFSALQAPGFVVMAGVSGIGLLIVIAALVRAVLGERERLSLEVFRWLGNLLMVLTVAYLYFVVVEWLTTTYQGQVHELKVTEAVLGGEYAWLYRLSVGSLAVAFVTLFGQFILGRHSIALIVFAGLAVQIAAVGKRFLLIVPSQTVGTLLPYQSGTYSPTWVEYSVITGLFALGALTYALFMKAFPIMEVESAAQPQEHEQELPATQPLARGGTRRIGVRGTVAGTILPLGVTLAIVSFFFLAAPVGTPTAAVYSNPRMIGAPLLFILGIMLTFLSAVVYEVLPERDTS